MMPEARRRKDGRMNGRIGLAFTCPEDRFEGFFLS